MGYGRKLKVSHRACTLLALPALALCAHCGVHYADGQAARSLKQAGLLVLSALLASLGRLAGLALASLTLTGRCSWHPVCVHC